METRSDTPEAADTPTILETPGSDTLGPRILARGRRMAMRMWVEDETVNPKEPRAHEYEVVGYVTEGSATLDANGQSLDLEAGDSYCIPPGVTHVWTIKSAFKCIEATSPPAQDVGTDATPT